MSGRLKGFRVLVTRARAQAAELVELLEREGAEAPVLPAIEYAMLEGSDAESLDRALREAGAHDVIVITSPRGAAAIGQRLVILGPEVRELLASRRLVAVGTATAKALAEVLREPDLIPEEFSAEGLLRVLDNVEGQRFLLLRADLAKGDLPLGLTHRGAQVKDVVAYRILRSDEDGSEVLQGPAPDFITFMSSSSVSNTLLRLTRAGRKDWLETAGIVCIGPVCAATAVSVGLRVGAVAKPSTIQGLVEALVDLVKPKTGATHA